MTLVVPAYSLAEPYETLTRRRRKRMKEELDVELEQIARSATHKKHLHRFRELTALLINAADRAKKRLEEVRSRLINAACVVPLDASILESATQCQQNHGFTAQDAIVYASVLSHPQQVGAPQNCFLNRNSKDFSDQSILDELRSYNCKLLTRFDSGYAFVRQALG